MKASGFVELLIIVSALVCGLPLFLACNTMANTDINTVYMNDKSTWDFSADVEYTVVNGVLTPSNLLDPLSLNPAQAAVLTMVQDEYTPNEVRTYEYNWDATELYDTDLSGANEFSVTIKENSRATRYGESNVTEKVLPISSMLGDTTAKTKYYLVYNYATKNWMITKNIIDIYTH
jgi:hypothetical protein